MDRALYNVSTTSSIDVAGSERACARSDIAVLECIADARAAESGGRDTVSLGGKNQQMIRKWSHI